jgi:hypothetical protein
MGSAFRLYSHSLPDLMRKKRTAAKLDAILSGEKDNPAKTPARPIRRGLLIRRKSSNSFEDVVSRVGIAPERRSRRLKPECLRTTRRNHVERGETW